MAAATGAGGLALRAPTRLVALPANRCRQRTLQRLAAARGSGSDPAPDPSARSPSGHRPSLAQLAGDEPGQRRLLSDDARAESAGSADRSPPGLPGVVDRRRPSSGLVALLGGH